MKYIILVVTLFIIPIESSAGDNPNYCLDADVNAEWVKMLSEAPKDNLVVNLFALRIGLCELVKRKIIDLDRSTEVFEKARASAVEERKGDELRQQHKSGKKA